jgi:hypothetical protein
MLGGELRSGNGYEYRLPSAFSRKYSITGPSSFHVGEATFLSIFRDRARRGSLSVFCGVGRGTCKRVVLVPLTALTAPLKAVEASLVFGWFVSWISSVVTLDLCNSASLNSVL